MRLQATQEGLVPLKNWIKSALDQVIQVCMGEPGLEFVWVGDDAIDPLQQAQTLNILVSAGIKTREEARAELGLGGDKAAAGLGKYNPNHDEAGGLRQRTTRSRGDESQATRNAEENQTPQRLEFGPSHALAGVLIDASLAVSGAHAQRRAPSGPSIRDALLQVSTRGARSSSCRAISSWSISQAAAEGQVRRGARG